MSDHTPGPWTVQSHENRLYVGPGIEIGGDEEEDLANAARIVACVNALEGVESPEAFVMAVRDGHCGQHPADCNLCAVVTGEAAGGAKPMTFDELYRAILDVLPEAEMGEEMDDQLVIFTGVMIGEKGEIKPCPVQKEEGSNE